MRSAPASLAGAAPPGVPQGNLWTEYLATEKVAEYMLMPRLCATAEALWSAREAKDWASFQARLRAHEPLWRRLGIRYRRLDG